jgi:hypothetical protein
LYSKVPPLTTRRKSLIETGVLEPLLENILNQIKTASLTTLPQSGVPAKLPEGGRPLGRPRRRWEDNIKMDQREVGWRVWTGSICLRIGTGGELL